ncbi:hypothetical protein L218DRAFT_407851 [Marasmius fiardii PR-910]|nr:hypothetical protein L218DRAFT_407851 [Marasmius fiardii PR-910]
MNRKFRAFLDRSLLDLRDLHICLLASFSLLRFFFHITVRFLLSAMVFDSPFSSLIARACVSRFEFGSRDLPGFVGLLTSILVRLLFSFSPVFASSSVFFSFPSIPEWPFDSGGQDAASLNRFAFCYTYEGLCLPIFDKVLL